MSQTQDLQGPNGNETEVENVNKPFMIFKSLQHSWKYLFKLNFWAVKNSLYLFVFDSEIGEELNLESQYYLSMARSNHQCCFCCCHIQTGSIEIYLSNTFA